MCIRDRISTGGSGGHVVPALNLYNHLKNEFDVSLYTDVRGTKYIPKEIKKTIFEVRGQINILDGRSQIMVSENSILGTRVTKIEVFGEPKS